MAHHFAQSPPSAQLPSSQLPAAQSPSAQSPLGQSLLQSQSAHSLFAQSPIAQSLMQSLLAQSPLAQSLMQSPLAQSPLAQSLMQSPLAQSPLAQSPLAQPPLAQSLFAQQPSAQSPFASRQSAIAHSILQPPLQSSFSQSPMSFTSPSIPSIPNLNLIPPSILNMPFTPPSIPPIPQIIYPSQFPRLDLPSESLWTFIFETTQHDPDLPVFIESATGRTLSRTELRNLSLEFAHGIRTCLPEGYRLSRGDIAMIFSPNSLAWPIALLGLVAGGVRSSLATSNHDYLKLAVHYKDSRARVVFSHPNLISVVFEMFRHIGISEDEARRRIVVLDFGEDDAEVARKEGVLGMSDILGCGALPEEEKFVGPQAGETVFISYSSGITTDSKGVETTHRNLTSMLLMAKVVQPPLPRHDIALGVLPYFYISSVVMNLFYTLFCGIPVVIMDEFDPARFCQAVERYKVTASLMVPPALLLLVRHLATNHQYDLRSLRVLTSCAAPLRAEYIEVLVKKLKLNGATVTINQGYGLSETSPETHFLPLDDAFRKIGSIGVLLPNLEARLVAPAADENHIVDSPLGMPGELWIRGPTVMKGYQNDATATANAITADGWFKTGDIVTRDLEGYYYFVDRKKNLISHKGFLIPPSELEAALLQHPDIVDAAVIGVYDPVESIEIPRAYVVHRSVDAPEKFAEAVPHWLKDRVPGHMRLHGGVVAVNSIPRSVSGKPLHHHLRERAKLEM